MKGATRETARQRIGDVKAERGECWQEENVNQHESREMRKGEIKMGS